ncbi:LRR receptor-like serine/threonine-protein kinase GSO1 [Prunus dulcis]|nr:LRR receptor-like serine/threonine-protein kinase GSO1 [Prunus dulcis]
MADHANLHTHLYSTVKPNLSLYLNITSKLPIMFMMKCPKILFLFGVVLLHYSCFLRSAISSSTSNFTDQSALLAIQSKLSFDPTNIVLGGNWTTKTSFCNWVGVFCSKRRQRVTALKLSYMALQGTISPHIGNLSFLVSLDLRNNSFFGPLPNEISRLHRLRSLLLHNNQLQGSIPPTLYHCQNLEVLVLEVNRLTGPIPRELGFLPRLRKLFLGVNNLTGTIPSPLGNISTLERLSLGENGLTGSFSSALLNLTSLTMIYLAKNSISGSLPVDLCHYWPNIQNISFSFNKFSGKIPYRIGQCRELQILSLSYNSFVGSIPEEVWSLQHLQILYLGGNKLTGTISPSIGNMSNLKSFAVGRNNIEGNIPGNLGHLSNLAFLGLAFNSLTGPIPQVIFNISSLEGLEIQSNALSGEFPSSAVFLPNLNSLLFHTNQITGPIPTYFSNFTKLTQLDADNNLLYGPIPMNLGSLKHLQFLNLARNQLTGEPGFDELRFLSSLLNSSSLEYIILYENPLNGIIPDSIGNFSQSLQVIYAPACQIRGHIPKSIGSLRNLTFLYLAHNNLSGKIPSSIRGLETLQRLYLQNNSIEGFVPNEICHLKNLGEILLSNNKISGLIPNCIGNLKRLQIVLLDSNSLTSSIPMSLWNLESLLVLNLSFNSFNGDLPQGMRKLNAVQVIDLSWNQISGNIPSIIGAFQSLRSLNLSNNLFVGNVPKTFGDLKGLEDLDLSHNSLSGTIPKSLETLKYLEHLNFSFNHLSGQIPSGGPFANFTAQSFLENGELCGRPDFGVRNCTPQSTQNSKAALHLFKYILPAIASTMILAALVYRLIKYHKKRNAGLPSSVEPTLSAIEHRMISYQELRRATNDFCESNALGVGSFGSVYKGILSNGTTVAVKVLNLQMEGALKSFDAECKVWRTIRHRNLVKVITSCSSHEVRALVLQYMCNGSLEKWLYSHNYCLNLVQRVSMMVDIALALEYLHHGQAEVVVHCDLKPSNILLDEDMVAHVGDFGLAKILAKNKDETQTRTIGTLGYVAPEYGSTGKVSTKGDVYSYGIMMLEIITRKKPTDEMFAGERTLRQWINESLPNNCLEVVDAGLLSIEEGRNVNATKNIILSIMEISLRCCEQVPEERMDFKDVVTKLMKIKLALGNRRNRV